MSYSTKNRRGLTAVLMVVALAHLSARAEDVGDRWNTAERERAYYRIMDIPIPKGEVIEAGAFTTLPDGRIAVGTRHGDIFLLTGVDAEKPSPRYELFATGLDEIFGLSYKDGAFYVTQSCELTRITDTNGDGKADRFETLSDTWGYANYHEYAFGSPIDKEGNIYVALGLSYSYYSRALFRGWIMKVTPDGKTIPIASGLRSPGGIGPNEHGAMFYIESQGPWNTACSLKAVTPGCFEGHPASFNWYKYAPNMGPTPEEPETGSRIIIEKEHIKQLAPYAVIFPYIRMGRSITGYTVNRTHGKFGPFEDQMFMGDYTQSIIMRATTEQVKGVWQGACYPFREGLSTGILNVRFTPEGNLLCGGTNRGWPVRGIKPFALERLEWTGVMPFEIQRITIEPDGFRIRFTKAVDAATGGDPASYKMSTFTHIYHAAYGGPEVDQTTPTVKSVKLSADGMEAVIALDKITLGHVHEFHLGALRSRDGEDLVHHDAYYTVNEVPDPVAAEAPVEVKPLSDEQAKEYTLDKAFYKKATLVQNILIATSDKVPDFTHLEAAYLFDKMLSDLKPEIAQRIRDRKVLCIIIGHAEQLSELPQFHTDKTGKERDFYNWRNRGFLNMDKNGHPTVLFAEEDVMEYEGGMQIESILIHEFGHVVAGAGFDDALRKRLTEAFENVKKSGTWNDGYAAQRFRRVTSETPVLLLDALAESFPDQPRAFLAACLDGGDILVNGKPSNALVEVTKNDKVLIVFGGPKDCYASKNKAEYWAEGFQTWYDTNRTMDHDHNHIHTRAQLKTYDPMLAKLCEDVMGDSSWRFVSPRERAGKGHLAGYDPATAPKVTKLPHIDLAAQDYYDEYWKDYWQRLHATYVIATDATDCQATRSAP